MKNKNKLLIIVMILLVLSLVNIVLAKGPLDVLKDIQSGAKSSGLIVIIVNAAIILAVAYTIFNLLKKGIDNKKHEQIIQILVVVFSVIVAIELNKSNPGAFLWQTRFFGNFLHPPVIINGLVIGGALYLLSQILLENQTKSSPQLQWAIRIIVVIMALNIVMEPFQPDKTWDDVKDSYKYVWQSKFWIRTKFYLFGDPACTFSDKEGKVQTGCYYESNIRAAISKAGHEEIEDKGKEEVRWGILTGNRIIVFVLLFFVLVVAGKTFIKTELIGEKFIYAISFLIASNMANTGTNIGNSVMIGQIVLSFALYYSMKDKVGKAKWVAMVVAILLVEFVSKTIFGDKAKTFLTPVVGPFMSDVVKIFGNGLQITDIFLLIGALFKALFLHPTSLIILGIIVALAGGFVAAKGAGEIGKRIRDIGPYIGPKLANILKQGVRKVLGLFRSKAEQRRKAKGPVEDAWPYVFLENRPLLQVLQHYNKRVEIFFNYWKQVKQNKLYLEKNVYPQLKKYTDFEILKRQLVTYRCGIKNKETGTITTDWTIDFDKEEVKTGWSIDLETGEIKKGWSVEGFEKLEFVGWNAMYIDIINLINRSNKVIMEALAVGRDSLSASKPVEESKKNSIITTLTDLEQGFISAGSRIEEMETEYKARLEAYGWHNLIKRIRYAVLDQCNISGYANHTYQFAPGGTKVYNPTTGATKPLPKNEEVDFDGNLIEDINKGNMNPRKVIKEDMPKIRHADNYLDVVNSEWGDWYWFIRDLRQGLLHPYSRTVMDYIEAIEHNQWNDKLVKREHTVGEKNPAMDLRAMKDPGRFRHAGKLKYNSETHRNHGDVCVCSIGLKEYFMDLADKDTQQAHLLEERFTIYPADTGLEDMDELMATMAEAKKGEGK